MNIHNIFQKVRKTSPLPLREGLGVGLCLLILTACEDYTDHNFGTRDELYQPKQVTIMNIEMTDADYVAVATDATNQALAKESNLAEALQSVADKKYFRNGISPDEYLLSMIQPLVGTTAFYTMDNGSIINVTCRVAEDSLADGPAYIPTTKFKAGKYLFAPVGQEQILGTSGLTADGEHPGYGYLYLTGGDKCPAITRINDEAITVDAQAKEYLYTFEANDEHFTIRNAAGFYLYLDGSHASFQYTDDLQSDCDEPEQGLWTVSATAEGTYDITNVATGQQLRYDTNYKSAGCYSPEKQTDNHQSIVLYQEGKISFIVDATPELQEYAFSKKNGEWKSNSDYLNQELTGTSSVDGDVVYALTGWSFENVGSIGDLTYVWKLDGTYGLRASSYKGQFYSADSWAISPKMKLKKAKKPVFEFLEAQKFSGTPLDEYLQVYVSTDYDGRGSQASAHWTNVTDRLEGTRSDGSSWDYMPIRLDMSEWAGQPSVYIAFRYVAKDNYAATWEVKNVICKEAE